MTAPEQFSKLDVRVVCITPEIAKELLKRNLNNRPMNEAHVEELARRMKQGEWQLNGETLILDEHGDMLNGQHRCAAVERSGVTIQTLMVGRVNHDAFGTIDNTRPKTHTDVLSAQGEMHAKLIAPALKVVDMYERESMRSKHAYSNHEIVKLLDLHPHVRESARICAMTKGLIPTSMLTALHYLFAKQSGPEALKFVDDLISGAGLLESDPVYVLRERLISNRVSEARLSKTYLAAITVKAWNARRKATPVRSLTWRESGDNPEVFPVIQ